MKVAIEFGIHAHESLALRIIEIDRVAAARRIEALLDEKELFLLERARRIDIAPDAQKHRAGIIRKALSEMVGQRRQIEFVCRGYRGHAGAAIPAFDWNTVDICLQNAIELVEDQLDFRGGNVLALPAERVADAIDEIEI